MLKANYMTATDTNGRTGKYPLSLETLSFIQTQIQSVASAFGAMFGSPNLILQAPYGQRDGLCLFEGELVPIDYRVSQYDPSAPLTYRLAIQTSNFRDFEENIRVGNETIYKARSMKRACLYNNDDFPSIEEFSQEEELLEAGVDVSQSKAFEIVPYTEREAIRRNPDNTVFMDVSSLFGSIPELEQKLSDTGGELRSLERRVKAVETAIESLLSQTALLCILLRALTKTVIPIEDGLLQSIDTVMGEEFSPSHIGKWGRKFVGSWNRGERGLDPRLIN